MQKSIILSVALAALSLAPAAKADVFAQADAAYAQRENNHEAIATARADYLAVLNGNSNRAQKIYAATQLGRLAIYEGEQLTPKSDTDTRKAIFSDCWQNWVEKINPSAVGENPAYYYFKGVCIAYWGEVVSPILAIPKLPVLNDMIAKGKVGSNADFEGGGIWRLAAGVHSNPKAKPIPGAYQPQAAIEEIANALASQGLKDARANEKVTGQKFYENWRGKATVALENGDVAGAKAAYQQGIAMIQADQANGTAPKSRKAETDWVLATMQSELAALGN